MWFKWFGFDFILCSNEVWILDRILRIFSSNDAPFSLLAMSTFKDDVPQWQSEVGPVLLFLPVALVGGTWWGYVWLWHGEGWVLFQSYGLAIAIFQPALGNAVLGKKGCELVCVHYMTLCYIIWHEKHLLLTFVFLHMGSTSNRSDGDRRVDFWTESKFLTTSSLFNPQ